MSLMGYFGKRWDGVKTDGPVAVRAPVAEVLRREGVGVLRTDGERQEIYERVSDYDLVLRGHCRL